MWGEKSKISGGKNYKADERTAPLVSMFLWTQNTFTETKPQPSEDNTDKNIFILTMLPQEWNLQSCDSKTITNGNAIHNIISSSGIRDKQKIVI
jgi:hypothetical protein